MKNKLKRQRPLAGGRMSVHSAFHPKLEMAIRREMARFNASRSFVIATCCGFALNVGEQESYKK